VNSDSNVKKLIRTTADPVATATAQLTGKELYRAIFDAAHPEQFVRSVPSQSLYFSIRERGLPSSLDLIGILPITAMRTILDLDLWQKDALNEDQIWEWLELTDDEDPLLFCQRFLKSVDLKLISFLILKYVQSVTFEQQADTPPGAAWYTPDKGYTWVFVAIEDSHRHFLMTRLLALIFETSAELFYQLLAIPSVATLSTLEEEAYNDKIKRLSADGVPSLEHAIELNSVCFPYQIQELLAAAEVQPAIEDIAPCGPLVALSRAACEPLTSALQQLADSGELTAELTLILNASLVFFDIPFHEYENVKHHASKVRGAINVGLQRAQLIAPDRTASDILSTVGLSKLYRLGLFEIFALRKAAKKLRADELKALQEDQPLFSIIAHARMDFPEAPLFLAADGTYTMTLSTDGVERLSAGSRPFIELAEVQRLRQQLEHYA
jgi:hypothetical protein